MNTKDLFEGTNKTWKTADRIEMGIFQDNKWKHEFIEIDENEVLNKINKWKERYSNKDLSQITLEVEYMKLLDENKKNEFMKSIIKKIKQQFPDSSADTIEYVWISIRNDSMPVVVGKTSTKSNDIFKLPGRGKLTYVEYETFLDLFSTKTEKIIIGCEFTNEDIVKFDEITKKYYGALKEVNNVLRNYTKKIFIIPINPNSNLKVDKLEEDLGDYLSSMFPLLNYHSHKNGVSS